MAMDMSNPTDISQAVPFDQFADVYKTAITSAEQQLQDARARAAKAADAKAALDAQLAADTTGAAAVLMGDRAAAADNELKAAQTMVEAANKVVVDAHTKYADAIRTYSTRAVMPQELKDRYAAMAAAEQANAQKITTETQEFLNSAPDRRDQLHATTLKAQADASLAQAQADLLSATSPIQKQQAQAALDLARQQVSTAQANEQSIRAGTGATIAGTAQTGAQTDLIRQQTRTAQAQADVAPAAAQAAVSQAQANVSRTQLEIEALERQMRQAPTDEQAQAAIQTQLQQKQVELATAQQQLATAQQLLPGQLAQQGATLEATQAATQRGLLGNLYGLQDKAKQIADMIRSGQITDPAQGMAQLQDYIQTTIQGTTPFERNATLLGAETQRRGQDYSLAASQGSTYANSVTSALGTFARMNDTVPIGSDAVGLGMVGFQRQMAKALQGFQPPQQAMDSPLMASMRPPAPAAPVAPVSGDAGHTITINIGGGGAPGPAPIPAAPVTPPMLSGDMPAMPNHVADLWASDPNLNPGALAATGVIDRTSRGLGGM